MNKIIYNDQGRKRISPQLKKKAHITGILLFLLVLLLIFILSLSGRMASIQTKNTQNLSLLKLVVTGKRNFTSNADIRKLILMLKSTNTLMINDIGIIQTQVIKHLPWIKQAIVRRQWPNKLRIHLVEYVPVAYWWNTQHMVDAAGHFFSVPQNNINQKKLPNLYGPKESVNEMVCDFCKMKQMLTKNRLILKNATMTTRRSWHLTLTNGIKLNLGHHDIMQRLLHFIKLYPVLQKQSLINNKWISYVDLRYNSGAAVVWKLARHKKLN